MVYKWFLLIYKVSYVVGIFGYLTMMATFLGPGTIFLMIIGALQMAFSLNLWIAFFLTIATSSLNICVCFPQTK